MSNRLLIATDESNRWKDQDGRLHVRWTNISKATVNPYYGREIPGYEALGLDSSRVYQLWRHPDELAKAAPTFNGIQLMSSHIGVDARNPQEEHVAGALGTETEFRPPYLGNSLTIWRAEDIAYIESGKKCQLSMGYYYDPDMTPGEIQGLRYDGIMRNIRANHGALVEEGRAGPDVIVADERLARMPALASRKALLIKGALASYLRPKLMVGTSLALDSALGSVNRLNWQTEKPKVLAAIMAAATPKLAKDMKLDDLQMALDRMDEEEDGEAEDDDLEAEDEADEDDDDDKKKKLAMEKKAKDMKRAKDKAARDAKRVVDAKAAEDAEEEDEEEDEAERKKEAKDSKKAMDAMSAGIRRDVVAQMAAAVEAREIVRPLIGQVALALDSAEAIYKLALDAAKVPLSGVPAAAFRAMVGMLPKPGQGVRALALDSSSVDSLMSKFPNASRIRIL
jgi:hypothetical protein